MMSKLTVTFKIFEFAIISVCSLPKQNLSIDLIFNPHI